jgi:hypothetical protein
MTTLMSKEVIHLYQMRFCSLWLNVCHYHNVGMNLIEQACVSRVDGSRFDFQRTFSCYTPSPSDQDVHSESSNRPRPPTPSNQIRRAIDHQRALSRYTPSPNGQDVHSESSNRGSELVSPRKSPKYSLLQVIGELVPMLDELRVQYVTILSLL